MQEIVTDIEAFGASIVVVSPQFEKYSRQLIKKHRLSFSLLRDEDNKIASQFGLVFCLPDDLRELYEKFGIDYERFYGNDSWSLPMPGRFILDRQGTILRSDVHPDYTKRPEPEDIINILENMQRHIKT